MSGLGRFFTGRGTHVCDDYAVIAAMRGWITMMFMTREIVSQHMKCHLGGKPALQFAFLFRNSAPEEIRTPDLRVSVSEVWTVLVCDFCSGSKATFEGGPVLAQSGPTAHV